MKNRWSGTRREYGSQLPAVCNCQQLAAITNGFQLCTMGFGALSISFFRVDDLPISNRVADLGKC
jgi:hypothetical protein